MAFTPEQIESSAPDAWTGKPTAIVYEPTATAATWLATRGLTAFSAATEGDQDVALLNATEAAEAAIMSHVRGLQVQDGQRLYLPADGAYDRHGNLLRASGDLLLERSVVTYLEGIRLIAEYMVGGSWMQLADPSLEGVKRNKTRIHEVEYKDGADPGAIVSNHRDVWAKIGAIFPRLI